MSSIKDNLLQRAEKWEGVYGLQPAKAALIRILNANDEIRQTHAKHASDKSLSQIGRQFAVQKHIADKTALELHRARQTVFTMRSKLDERRSRLLPKPSDKTDVAAAMLRSDLRTALRGMGNASRMALLLAPDADPTAQAAVLEGSNILSGISDQTRELVLNAVIERTYPGQLAAIEQANEAIDALDAATRHTVSTVKAAGEFPSESVLVDFVEGALPDMRNVNAEIERNFRALAKVEAADALG